MKKFASTLNIGAIRTSNQDQVCISHLKGLDLMLVCDGMGGANAGDVASKLCKDYIEQAFIKKPPVDDSISALSEWARQKLIEANQVVLSAAHENPNYHGMGTTAVLALVSDKIAVIANVGDSRAYAYQENKLSQITIDHTLVNQWILEGKMSELEAKRHPQRSVLTNVLGVSENMRIDLFEVGDIDYLLLCSDGVSGMLSDYQMEALIDTESSIKQIVLRIEKEALALGGYDNIAIACVKWV